MTAALYIVTGMVFLIGFIVLDIQRRLPRSDYTIPRADRPTGHKNFALWMEIEEIANIEFRAGMIDGWEAGLEFDIFGSASCDEQAPEVKRAHITVSSNVRWDLNKTEVFGRGKVTENSLRLNLWLGPREVESLLSVIKAESAKSLHAQGFYDKGGVIRITYITCEESNRL